MDNPLGYLVDNIVKLPITSIFRNTNTIEEFKMAGIPGALSAKSEEILRKYIISDTSGKIEIAFVLATCI